MRLVTLSLLIFALTVPPVALAADELRAIAEDGRRVLLSPDGRWKFDDSSPPGNSSAGSSGTYQTQVRRFSLAFNPTDWTLTAKRDGDEQNKRTFNHKSLPIYAMVIADEIPATTAAMKDAIITNAQAAGAATTVLLDQTQSISGKSVGSLRLAAAIKGLDFVFSTLYYADPDGNIQVTCYTGQAVFFKYQLECQKLQAGLTIK